MDLSKGLFSDSRPQDIPEGFYLFSKNGLSARNKGAKENEPGFVRLSAILPYPCNGVIETDKYPIVTCTDNVNSGFGYVNIDTGQYQPIANDATFPFKFGWNTDNYITGESQRNSKGEMVIAITDKVKDPLYINCDKFAATTLESLFLFPRATPPVLTVSQDQGGAIYPGAYYVTARYTKTDGTETSYLVISDSTIVKGTPNNLTDKTLVINITNIDTTYNYVQLAIISRINGIVKVVEMQEQVITGTTMTQVFSGGEITTDLTLEEVLINPAVYSRVQTFGQVNDSLYAADLSKLPRINMQQYANLVAVEWESSLISVIPPTPEHISGAKRHFMHQEVYCLYIQYSLTYGGWSDGFIITGLDPLPADLATATELGQELLATGGVPKYKVEDTIHGFDPVNKTGAMGIWKNENETYPDTIDFDSSAIGGRNLRNKPVLHHRFPSIIWCKENLYANDPDYGKTKLDLLGLRISNVIIPAKYISIITGWRIVYAKRSLANSTVIGQAVLLHASRAANSVVDTNYISTGGNWGAKMDFKNAANDKQLNIDKHTFRFHSFDMLFSQPSVAPSYIAPLLKLYRPNLAYDGGMIEDFSITPDSKNGPIVYLIDYPLKGAIPTVAPTGKRIRKISDSSYVPNNTIVGKWKNLQQELIYGGSLTDTREILTDAELSFSNLWVGPEYEQPDKAAQFEYTYLTNLMALKNNLYSSFTTQPLISAGQRVTGGSGSFYGGDCFLNDYTFHTYGWNDYDNRGYGGDLGGIKVARRIICEAVSNINVRYEIIGNIYSKWYPNSALAVQDPNNYILPFNRNLDPNQFGYSRDLSAVNEFIYSSVFSPVTEDITEFPFRIHRGGKLSRQDKRRSWRTFLPLDYYEAQKNMGRIINLESFTDRLIIHHENAIFLTQGKTILENGLLSGITIGSADIFSTEPQEELPTKLGYAGTQHDLACIKTPLGYIFPDSKQAQVFMFNGKLQLANNGLNNFLQQYMRVKGKNTFTGNGFTFGYDPKYKRLLMTVKNKVYAGVVKDYQETAEFFATLIPGDVVYKNGRYQTFLGVNSSSQFICSTTHAPVIGNFDFTIPEDAPVGTIVGTLTGLNVTGYIISHSGSFLNRTFEVQGNKVILIKQVNYEVQNLYTLTAVGIGDGGQQPFTITIHITDVINEAPIVYPGAIAILETAAIASTVFQVQATNEPALPLIYSLVGGNTATDFSINAGTGMISTFHTLDTERTAQYDLVVNVSNGTKSSSAIITVVVGDVSERPDIPDILSFPIYQNRTPGRIGTLNVFDPEGGPVIIQTLHESVPGAFTVVSTTGDIILNEGTVLNPSTTPVYTMSLRAIDNTDLTTEFDITIETYYDPATLIFEPITASCAGTTKHWASVKIKTASVDITTVSNVFGPQYFQNIHIPYYPGVGNSIDCGGVNNVYFSEFREATVTKNDCVTGLGSAVRYTIPAGAYTSTTSVAAANALADADVTANAQTYANTYGTCNRTIDE